MFAIAAALLRYLLFWLCPKHELALENLALRQQIAVLNRPAHKPRLLGQDRLFWVVLKAWWPNWRAALILFQPETVLGWQRAGFKMFWRWKSRPRGGRPRKDDALIQLIRWMSSVNPTWGSPRIRDELAKLGLEVSTATIRNYRPRSRRPPSQSWRTFLQNHAGAIAAMDFFVVPTATFRLLYVLVVMSHERRKVLHFTSPRHRPQRGRPSRSSMRSPTTQRPGICCGTAIRSTDRSSCSGLRAWASSRS
jgi:hypothetical protein